MKVLRDRLPTGAVRARDARRQCKDDGGDNDRRCPPECVSHTGYLLLWSLAGQLGVAPIRTPVEVICQVTVPERVLPDRAGCDNSVTRCLRHSCRGCRRRRVRAYSAYQPRCASRSPSAIALTAMPTIGSPSPSESSERIAAFLLFVTAFTIACSRADWFPDC